MVVCLCYGVSEDRIRALQSAGHKTPDSVADACGAGSCCGCCQDTIAQILESPFGAAARDLSSAGVSG